jgi:UDP-N-acetyl-D-mannosaminuronic acid transferase (WecB/TagA/CpsF family)
MFSLISNHDDECVCASSLIFCSKLFKKLGYSIDNSHQYVAPFYNSESIVDFKLLELLSILKPKYIIINLGGGIQEKLAAFLQKEITSFSPSIICTGAAIAFLSGQQARIPELVDRLYLGWLVRCLTNYKRFVPRYIQGFRILPMLFREKIRIRKLSI